MIDDLKLIQLITGEQYYGRTVRECPECKGERSDGFTSEARCPACSGLGVVWREWLPCENGCKGVAFPDALPKCILCEDTGRIPDTEGRKAIESAVEEWYGGLGKIHPSVVLLAGEFEFSWWLFWINRHSLSADQKQALEDHVRQWQAPVPNLTANDGAELKRILPNYQLGKVTCNEATRYYAMVEGHETLQYANTEGEALLDSARAAVAATGGAE